MSSNIDFLNFLDLSKEQHHNIVKNYLLGKQSFVHNDLSFEYSICWRVVCTNIMPNSKVIGRVHMKVDDVLDAYIDSVSYLDNIRVGSYNDNSSIIFRHNNYKIVSFFKTFGVVRNIVKDGKYFICELNSGVRFRFDDRGYISFYA